MSGNKQNQTGNTKSGHAQSQQQQGTSSNPKPSKNPQQFQKPKPPENELIRKTEIIKDDGSES